MKKALLSQSNPHLSAAEKTSHRRVSNFPVVGIGASAGGLER